MMNSRIKNLFGAVVALLIPVILAACSLVKPVEKAADPRIAQLIAGMDRCLESQVQTVAQLERQEAQLDQQARQLKVLAEEVQAGHPLPLDAKALAAPAVEGCVSPPDLPSKLVVGQREQIWLQNLQLSLPARIDTGAETASLDARNIELFERDGRRWVRFEIQHPQADEFLQLERKLKRMVAIIQSNTVESERRPVIQLGVTLGHISQTAEFTLSNRSHLDHQVLIGRNILKDFMVVDVSQENIAPYVAPESPDDQEEAAQ